MRSSRRLIRRLRSRPATHDAHVSRRPGARAPVRGILPERPARTANTGSRSTRRTHWAAHATKFTNAQQIQRNIGPIKERPEWQHPRLPADCSLAQSLRRWPQPSSVRPRPAHSLPPRRPRGGDGAQSGPEAEIHREAGRIAQRHGHLNLGHSNNLGPQAVCQDQARWTTYWWGGPSI
jgi:hypothetical protein